MEKITSTNQLIDAIRLLEIKQKQEENLLKQQLKVTYESLKPASLIKNTIKDLIATPDLKTNLVSTILSVAAGYTSKKIMLGESTNPIKKLLGSLFQIGVTSVISNKADGVVSGLLNVVKNIPLFKTGTKHE